MALATIQHPNPRLDLWGYRTLGTATQAIDKPMTSIMTYQNHLASSGFSSLQGAHPTYAMGFDQTRAGTHHPPPPSQQQSSRMNSGNSSRASLSGFRDNGPPSRRSFSTPMNGVRQEVTPEQTSHPGTPNEKKRTKLGYHRTSIACSKITNRLLLALWVLGVFAPANICQVTADDVRFDVSLPQTLPTNAPTVSG
jgi:hypothetical protein